MSRPPSAEPSATNRALWVRGRLVLLRGEWMCCKPFCGEAAIWGVPGGGVMYCDDHVEVRS